MRRLLFNYPATCPKIDKAIDSARGEIKYFIKNLLSDACGLLSNEQRELLAKDYSDKLYSYLEAIFEETRQSNSDMREEAEAQVEQIQQELDSLKKELAIAKAEGAE